MSCSKFHLHLIIFVFFFKLVIPFHGFSQSERKELTIDISVVQKEIRSSLPEQNNKAFILTPIQVPIDQPHSLISMAVHVNIINGANLWLRKADKTKTWGNWELVNRFHEKSIEDRDFVSELLFLQNNEHWIQIQIIVSDSSAELSDKLTISFFQPEKTAHILSTPMSDCLCTSPAFVNRVGWNCPDGQNPSCNTPVRTDVSHLIVHHSAGINQANDWGAIVLSIWDFHVRTNGWCDIGYNWLIDPNGVLYQGRGGEGDIRGAHFCGTNSRTMGVCLLGNFEIAEPTEAALNTLDSLLSWKSCDVKLAPLENTFHTPSGRILPVIAGHKDGCGTICPGANLYPLLPNIRERTQTRLEACNNPSNILQANLVSSIKLYPNPNNGSFQLAYYSPSTQEINIRIINLIGQEVFHQEYIAPKGRQLFSIQTKGIQTGYYFLLLSSEEGVLSRLKLHVVQE